MCIHGKPGLWFIRFAFLSVVILSTCTHQHDWLSHDDFAYQLQGYQFDRIRDSGFSLFVVDVGLAGNSAERLEELRNVYPGNRKVLCYLSIGEAEDYRSYWKSDWKTSPPSFLDEANQRWKGNYKVKYWLPEWQQLVYGSEESLLDEIIALGFDGVYLDIVDAYQYYEERGRENAAAEMVEFVMDMARYARRKNPDFGVFPQNAEELGTLFPEYLKSVDGIGVEDLFYGNPLPGEVSPIEWAEERIETLLRWKEAGKLVLTVDYALGDTQIFDAYRQSRELGFVPYVSIVSLGTLQVNPGLDPESLLP
jgi:cysteinyl-tRNA synthetase